MNTNLLKIGLALIALLGLGFVFNRFLDLRSQQLRNEAVTDCLRTSGVYEYTNSQSGVRTTAPQKEIYRSCMADKGYTASW